jgi:hypothetical protein
VSLPNLEARVASLPLIICGPILRRVTPTSVTVWLALSKPYIATLTVHDSDQPDRMMQPHLFLAASAPAVRIGEYLHIVAVTARASDRELAPGTVYFYDLSFVALGAAGPPFDFLGALHVTGDNPLAYGTMKLPSFALPPALPEQLRLVHGSCRKPHGNGDDALSLLDDRIDVTALSALDRPHQLILTGDQIYSDEVADCLLPFLTEAGDVLLGGERELLTHPLDSAVVFQARHYLPLMRAKLCHQGGFTSGLCRSHLFSLGEWLSMYLFVWSDILWPVGPSEEILTFAELESSLQVRGATADVYQANLIKDEIEKQRTLVIAFKAELPKVRRALANVPTYMIFDDHDVTDDWNLTYEFCSQVYNGAFGRRLVQNALVAYALCQAWGNTPEQFEDVAPAPAGRKLLDLFSSSTPYDQLAPQLWPIIGLHSHAVLEQQGGQNPPYRVYHDGGALLSIHGQQVNDTALDYHFTYLGPAHRVIFTDTRSWRSFPGRGSSKPDLIAANHVVTQVGSIENGDRVVIVVVSTNMPPIPSIRAAERTLSGSASFVYQKDLADSWVVPSSGLDRMIAQLSELFPLKDDVHVGRVVLISGDVHSSFANRLMYWATSRYIDEPTTPKGAKVVFAQLVSSPLKNQDVDTEGQHRQGYKFAPTGLHGFVPSSDPTYVLGYNVRISTPVIVKRVWVASVGGGSSFSENLSATHESPSFAGEALSTAPMTDYTYPAHPNYRYRLDNIFADARGAQPAAPPLIDPMSGATADARRHAMQQYSKATNAYLDYANKVQNAHQIVGFNNLSEITLSWGPDDAKAVHHTVRWREPSTGLVFWVRYTISLGVADQNYSAIGPALPWGVP